MDDDVYGVWLQLVFGEASDKVPLLLEYFGSCRNVYESDDMERHLSGLLTDRDLSKMANTPLGEAAEIVCTCRRLKYRVLTPDSVDYPNRLRNIRNYPAALYISGEWPDIDNTVCIGMVGTRRPSRYGYDAATKLSKDLAACGALIVSGGARGIDTASHQGALIGGGKTLCVLGCGINTNYNNLNKGLRNVISTSGAVISEYPPGAQALGYHFPARNRIISALSLGVIVVEAGVRSGSLITANLALEQGKDLFAVPGEISNIQAQGTNRLIAEGAMPIQGAQDVLAEYVMSFPHKIRSVNLRDKNSRVLDKTVRPKWEREASAKTSKEFVERLSDVSTSPEKSCPPKEDVKNDEAERLVGMSENALKVYRSLTPTPKTMQELISELNMSASSFMQSITELELYDKIKTLPGKRYSKK